jgi:hypothetical protein
MSKIKQLTPEEELLTLDGGATYSFPVEVDGIRLSISWVSKQQGIMCDLDLTALIYDERVSPFVFFHSLNSMVFFYSNLVPHHLSSSKQ